ncbi:MAG TPA: DUF3299 domain-containing protein [Pyrinomonadaceae bacterium]|nr:DUF3299 domain-containing protein [Pyrinomonadaceae bacterium]
MENRNTTSGLVAVLKTAAFFAVILGIVIAAVYFGTGKSAVKTQTKDGYQSLDISDLADYDYYTPFPGEKPDEKLMAENKIPDEIKNLNGKRVSVTGFVMPVAVDDEGNVREFALNGNYDMCFYGAPSQINQWIHVKMKDGAKAKFSHNPTTVSGTLEVGELVEDGQVISLYRLTGDKASSGASERLF